MRVVVNGLAALKPKTGVGHHVAELVAALRAQASGDQFLLYPGQWLGRAAGAISRPVGGTGERTRPARLRWLRGAVKTAAKTACRVHFSGFVRAFRPQLYHEPNFVPFPTRLPTVVTVHDLSVLKYPQWHPADRVRLHQKQFLKGLGRARHVIVVSESVRHELITELGCPAERVTAVHNGIGMQFTPPSAESLDAIRQKWKLPEQYFLCVGTIEPRKNIATVMRAFLELPAELRRHCPLILAGPWGWKSDTERTLFHTAGADSGLRHLGYIADGDLPALYGAARVLLYPSHYEGFGLPPVEMLACGGAVLASTAAAVQEVVRGHAWFIDADDLPGWRETMKRAVYDDAFLARLRAGGTGHAAQFTWAGAAERTLAVYRRVLGLPRAGDIGLSLRVAG